MKAFSRYSLPSLALLSISLVSTISAQSSSTATTLSFSYNSTLAAQNHTSTTSSSSSLSSSSTTSILSSMTLSTSATSSVVSSIRSPSSTLVTPSSPKTAGNSTSGSSNSPFSSSSQSLAKGLSSASTQTTSNPSSSLTTKVASSTGVSSTSSQSSTAQSSNTAKPSANHNSTLTLTSTHYKIYTLVPAVPSTATKGKLNATIASWSAGPSGQTYTRPVSVTISGTVYSIPPHPDPLRCSLGYPQYCPLTIIYQGVSNVVNASSFPTMTSMTSKRVVYWPTQEFTTISGTVYAIPLHGPNARFCHAGHIQYCRTDDDWPGLNYTQTQTVNLTGPQIVSWSASVSSARGSDCSSSYSSAERAYFSAAMTTHYVVSGFTRRSYLNPLSSPDQNACCGARCALNNPRADVLFFPSAGGNTATVFMPPTKNSTSIPKGGNAYSTRKSSTTVSYPMITSQIATLPRAIQARVKSFVANDSSNAAAGDAAVSYPTMLVSDGYTFRAPSIYIIFHEVWASDLCGIRGTPRTAVTLGFGPGELSTLIGPQDMPIYSSMALDPADLPCPRSWRPGAFGAEENCKPLIVPPQKLLDVDPLWHGCEANQFQGLDPPRALAPAAAIDPAVTVAGPKPKPTLADPASVVGNPGPMATTSAGNANKPWPAASVNPSDPAKVDENGSNDQQPSNPQPANPQLSSPQAANPQPENAQAADSKPADLQPVNPSKGQPHNQGDPNQGSNSGNSDPQPQQDQGSGGSNSNPQPQQNQDSPFQDSGFGDPNSQPQQNPPAVVIQGQTVTENAPPVTIGGTPVVYSSGSLYVGGNAAPMVTDPTSQQQQQPHNQPNAAVVGGYTFSPAPSSPQPVAPKSPAVVVQGQTIAENGPPVVIGGSTLAYLEGSVYVGGNAAPAPTSSPQQQQAVPNPAVVGGLTFSQAPADPGSQGAEKIAPAVVVQGQTIKDNGPPITIGGSPVAFSAGSVYVGSSAAAAPVAQQQQPNPAVVDGFTFSSAPLGAQGVPAATPAVVAQGQTIAQGGAPVTINGDTIRYSAGSIYVGNDAVSAPTAIPQQQAGAPAVISGLTFSNAQQPGSQPAVIFQGQTIAENGPPVNINGNEVKYSSGSIYVGNSAVAAPTANQQFNANPAVLGGMTYSIVQPNAQAVAQPTGFIFDGQTVVNGAPPITIQGQPVSLGAAGLVVGGSTYARSSAAPVAIVGGQSITVGPSGIEVGGKLLTPGAPAITIAGTPISLGPAGVVIGSTTIAITAPPGSKTPLVTVAGHTVVAGSLGAIAIDGTTLTPGDAAITVSGTPISLGASGLIVGTSTIPLPASSVFQVGGQTFTANPTAFAVAGTTLSVGGPAATISGTVVSLGPSGLQIGTQTYAIPSSTQSVFTVGGQTFTANPTAFAVAGTTLSVGGPAATISGTVVSLGPSGLQIGSNTYSLPSAAQSVFIVGGQTFTANPTAFAVAGTTLSVGGPAATISGTVISLGPSGLQIGSKTYALPSATQSIFTVGSQTFTANPSGFVIAPGTTLTRGGAATISGTVVSLASDGSLVIGGSTVHLPTPTQSVFTVGSQTFIANPSGFVIAPGTTLTRGGAATISGTIVSLASDGNLVIGDRTIPLPTPTQSIFTIGDKIFTANPTGFVIAPGTTITPGGVATISGTVVSLASNGDLVIGSSSTIRLSRGNTTATTTAGSGLGPAIISGLGGAGPTSTNAPADEEAKGTTHDLPLSLLLGILLVVAVWGYC